MTVQVPESGSCMTSLCECLPVLFVTERQLKRFLWLQLSGSHCLYEYITSLSLKLLSRWAVRHLLCNDPRQVNHLQVILIILVLTEN